MQIVRQRQQICCQIGLSSDTEADDLRRAEQPWVWVRSRSAVLPYMCTVASGFHLLPRMGSWQAVRSEQCEGLAACCAAECAPTLLLFCACSQSGHRGSSRSECGSPRATSHPEPIPGSPAAGKPPRPPAGGAATGVTQRDAQPDATTSAACEARGIAPPGAPQASGADSAAGGDAEGEASISWAAAVRVVSKLSLAVRQSAGHPSGCAGGLGQDRRTYTLKGRRAL